MNHRHITAEQDVWNELFALLASARETISRMSLTAANFLCRSILIRGLHETVSRPCRLHALDDGYRPGGHDGYLPVLKPLPGITSRNCLKRATRTDADGSILDVEYEYTLDSDGNISKIKLSGMMTYITNGIQHEAPLGEGVLCVKY